MLYFGHVLLAKGISANPEKVENITDCPVPQNIKEMQSFLELTSYYRQFINHSVKKAQCHHKLVGPTANKTKRMPVLKRRMRLLLLTQNQRCSNG